MLTRGRPRVVALVPVWNAAGFIEATLDSLASQTYPNLEILISNDASTDATGAICDRFAVSDMRFRVVHQPKNLGWIGNVNVLLGLGEGDYFFFAFHDDLLLPEFVERLVEALESDPGAVLAFCDIEVENVDGAVYPREFPDLDGITDRYQRVRMMARKPLYNWIPNRGVFRAEASQRVGGLRRNLAGEFVADWPWLMSLLVTGSFVRVPERLCRKVYKQASVSRSWRHTPLKRMAVLISCGQIIREAHFSLPERLRLYGVLIRSYPLVSRRMIRTSISAFPVLERALSRWRSVPGADHSESV